MSPLLDCSSPETIPIKIECGWEFSTILMKSGDVYAWWPLRTTFEDQYQEAMTELDKDQSMKAIVFDNKTVIPCHTWEIKKDSVRLPVLPDLPDLPVTGLSEEECSKDAKLIKIAALDNCLIRLTNKGHVLKMDELTNKDSIQIWHYMSESTADDSVSLSEL